MDSKRPSSAPNDKVDLTQTLYHELKKVAISKMQAETTPQTLQATALVHEAWLRIGGDKQPDWVNRAQFFSSAAEAMRRILIDRARRRQAIRHGGKQSRVDLDDEENKASQQIEAPAADKQLLILHEAISELEEGDPETAELVKLFYFAGIKMADAATMMNMSPRTASRRLAFARAWLGKQIQQTD
jgi:RNA polymerase sigma factor (TIGR02999 family)